MGFQKNYSAQNLFAEVSKSPLMNKSVHSIELESPAANLPDFMVNSDELRFCQLCEIVQPLRTKHCKECEACVAKYDHHCFWVGSCIGELNLRKFWLMLFFQVLTFSWIFLITILALNKRASTFPENAEQSGYGTFMLIAIICFLSLCFVAFLWVLVSYSILTNQSSWEQASRGKITYLQKLPQHVKPFHRCAFENVSRAFFHNGQLNNWEISKMRF